MNAILLPRNRWTVQVSPRSYSRIAFRDEVITLGKDKVILQGNRAYIVQKQGKVQLSRLILT